MADSKGSAEDVATKTGGRADKAAANASKPARVSSIRWVRACISKCIPVAAESDLTNRQSDPVNSPGRRTRRKR
jgi:hypothetical protein